MLQPVIEFSGRHRILYRVLVSVSLSLTVLMTGCGGPNDPRAYPGSQNRSLENLLEIFDLRLPQCKVEGLHYYSRSDLSGDLSITFRSSEGCIEKLLESLGVMGPPVRMPGKYVGISSISIKKFGWPIDPKVMYDYYGARSKTASFDIVVDRRGAQPVIYLHGILS